MGVSWELSISPNVLSLSTLDNNTNYFQFCLSKMCCCVASIANNNNSSVFLIISQLFTNIDLVQKLGIEPRFPRFSLNCQTMHDEEEAA